MCSLKWVFLKNSQNSQAPEYTCTRVSFLIMLQAEVETCNLIKKETLAHVVSCELCKVFKNTFSYRTPSLTASAHTKCIVLPKSVPILYSVCRRNPFSFFNSLVLYPLKHQKILRFSDKRKDALRTNGLKSDVQSILFVINLYYHTFSFPCMSDHINSWRNFFFIYLFIPFVPNVLFLYLLKTSENRKVF